MPVKSLAEPRYWYSLIALISFGESAPSPFWSYFARSSLKALSGKCALSSGIFSSAAALTALTCFTSGSPAGSASSASSGISAISSTA